MITSSVASCMPMRRHESAEADSHHPGLPHVLLLALASTGQPLLSQQADCQKQRGNFLRGGLRCLDEEQVSLRSPIFTRYETPPVPYR